MILRDFMFVIGMSPNVYIRKYEIKLEELKKQLIPLDEELWDIKNYDKFLNIRSELIARELISYLENLYPEYYNNF